jgi:hypothetical protein
LAEEIGREVELAERAWRDAFGHAIRAGAFLIEAKAQVRHGEWLSWLEQYFSGSVRSAQGYMKLARHKDECATIAHLGVRGALKQLAAPRAPDHDEEAGAEDGPIRFLALLQRLYDGRGHEALGYASWEELARERFPCPDGFDEKKWRLILLTPETRAWGRQMEALAGLALTAEGRLEDADDDSDAVADLAGELDAASAEAASLRLRIKRRRGEGIEAER